MSMKAHEDILHSRQVREEANILIRARNSKTNDSVGQQANEGVVVQQNLSGLGPVEAGNAIEKGRLASTIGSDDTVDAVLFDFYVQTPYGNQAAEAFGDFFC